MLEQRNWHICRTINKYNTQVLHVLFSVIQGFWGSVSISESKAEKLHKVSVNKVIFKNLQGMSLIITWASRLHVNKTNNTAAVAIYIFYTMTDDKTAFLFGLCQAPVLDGSLQVFNFNVNLTLSGSCQCPCYGLLELEFHEIGHMTWAIYTIFRLILL